MGKITITCSGLLDCSYLCIEGTLVLVNLCLGSDILYVGPK